MSKRIILAAVAAVMVCMSALAAGTAKASFIEKSHDFGYIKEAKGAVSHTFEFTNTGDKPLVIYKVTTECGCTRPEFPTKPIKPGKKGKIKVTYSPIGRPGAFRKVVKVMTNGSEKRTALYIEGTVIPVKSAK